MANLNLRHSNKFEMKTKQQSWLTFFNQPRIWSFHVIVLQRTAGKCTNNYNARVRLLREFPCEKDAVLAGNAKKNL